MPCHILIVDPEHGSLGDRLAREGFEVHCSPDTASVPADSTFDLILMDSRQLAAGGIGFLDRLRSGSPEFQAILLDGHESKDPLRQILSPGISRVFSKPLDLEAVVQAVRQVTEDADVRHEARQRYGLSSLIGSSPKMQAVLHLSRRVARSEAPAIFIRGETGTGKDLLARGIHYDSSRAQRPFITVMCTALQDTLLENDLFGHEKGAFTDAKDQKKGLFELADGGTIFLNEIGDMGATLQAKLLRVLDEQTFRRVGGSEDIRVDVRVISATNRDLEQSIREGKFRADLFYRLNIFPIYLPPLRDRMDDLPLFVDHFLKRNARRYRRPFKGVQRTAMTRLQEYDWPGNVRELRNVLERACALAPGEEIREDDLTFWRMGANPGARRALTLPPEGVVLDQVEKDLVLQALERSDGNQTLAAALLGLSRYQLRGRMKKYGLGLKRTSPKKAP